MKEYPLTGAEMWTLAGVGLAATLAFGAGSFFLSMWFDVFRDLSAPPSEWTEETLGYWKAIRTGTGWATVTFYSVGALLTFINGLSVRRIMRETEHPE